MAAVAVLNATTTLLRIKLAEVSTTASTVLLNYLLKTASTASYPYPKLTALSLLANTYATIAVPASSGDTWVVPSITISNNDNVSHTYTVEYYDGTNLVLLSSPITLQAGKAQTIAVGGSGGSGGGGGVSGPASSTNRAKVTWSGTAGDTLLNNSNNTVDASGNSSDISESVTGTGGAGFLGAVAQSAAPSAPAATGLNLYSNASGYLAWRLKNGTDTFVRALIGVLTGDQTWTTPDKSGMLALTSDLPSGGQGANIRLSLNSTNPYDNNTSAATSVYAHPINDGRVELLVGGVKTPVTQSGIKTISLSGATASKCYDIFAYESSGDVAYEKLVWTNDTTRATALAWDTTLNWWVKSGATTRRWVGTIYIDSGGGACTSTASIRHLQNAQNLINLPIDCVITRGTNYLGTASGWVNVNNTTLGSGAFSWVQGFPDAMKAVNAVWIGTMYQYTGGHQNMGLSEDGATPVITPDAFGNGTAGTYVPFAVTVLTSSVGRHSAQKQAASTGGNTWSMYEYGIQGTFVG